jgi:hypothetical protein
MTQAPKKKKKKKLEDFTTEGIIKKVFPKKVVKELDKITGKSPNDVK